MSMPLPAPVREDLPWNTAQRPAQHTPQDPLAGLKPKLYPVKGGRKLPYFGIGDLAKLLGREADTLRKWEEKGWLPTNYPKFPGLDPEDEKSAKYGRRRLYTRAHLLGLLQIAREEGILQKHNRPIKETNFPARAAKLFTDLETREKVERQRREAERAASGRVR